MPNWLVEFIKSPENRNTIIIGKVFNGEKRASKRLSSTLFPVLLTNFFILEIMSFAK